MKWVVLLLLLFTACVQPAVQPVPTVQPAVEEKIVEKIVVQCWDGSAASSVEQCPQKEEKIIAKEVVAPEPQVVEAVPIGRQLLAQAQAHDGYAYEIEDRLVLVSGDKVRHVLSKVVFIDRKPFTDVFVDLTGKTAVAYCDIEHEAQILGNAFTWSDVECKNFIDKSTSLPFEDWGPKGPLDYLADFAGVKPDFVEEGVQTVSIWGSPRIVQPSLHYSIGGVRVVLHIDQRSQVPIQIEIQGQQPISFRNVYFDSVPLFGKQEKIAGLLVHKPVSQEWLEKNAQ